MKTYNYHLNHDNTEIEDIGRRIDNHRRDEAIEVLVWDKEGRLAGSLTSSITAGVYAVTCVVVFNELHIEIQKIEWTKSERFKLG